jgi:hypothetical protein
MLRHHYAAWQDDVPRDRASVVAIGIDS